MSIRYKFIGSLLALTGICLGIYIWIAKSVFETDKETAIFEAAAQTSQAQAFTLKQQLDVVLAFAGTLMTTVNQDLQTFSPIGAELFADKKELLAIGIFENGKFLSFQSKEILISADALAARLGNHPAVATVYDKLGRIVISSLVKSSAADIERRLVVVLSLDKQLEMLKFTEESGGSFLSIGEVPMAIQKNFPYDLAGQVLVNFPAQKNLQEQTSIANVANRTFLISSRNVQFGELRVLNIIPKDLAFIGLKLLYRKSLQFFGLIFFIVLFVSVMMTAGLLKNLDRLTAATSEISKGQFDANFDLKSNDEFGKLAKSFGHMSREIKRLIIETMQKARMESELKTAQAVQENLFPAKSFNSKGLEINGLYRPASECGGDWWYHFQHATGVYVFVCDATGHGAPAALLTAAAKAAVNLMTRDPDLNIIKLTTAFNYALYETAHGNLLMTGFVLQIKPDQSLEYVNASHEPPLVFDENGLDFLIDPIGPRFGQAVDTVYETATVKNTSGKLIVLYTDGITGQINGEGKELGDKRFTRMLEKFPFKSVDLASLNEKVFASVDEFRGTADQADDLTIVSIRFS